jgi:hypothetical protein
MVGFEESGMFRLKKELSTARLLLQNGMVTTELYYHLLRSCQVALELWVDHSVAVESVLPA